jgi:hypothetical protein
MHKIAWLIFLMHTYALVLSGWLMSLPLNDGSWFASLPWMYWGTDLLEAVVFRQAPQPGSVWLGLLVLHLLVGSFWLLSWAIFGLVALIYNAALHRVESDQAKSHRGEIRHGPGAGAVPEPPAASESVNDWVKDPEIQQLMQDLEKRLRA